MSHSPGTVSTHVEWRTGAVISREEKRKRELVVFFPKNNSYPTLMLRFSRQDDKLKILYYNHSILTLVWSFLYVS
jgi:hypothetical protein